MGGGFCGGPTKGRLFKFVFPSANFWVKIFFWWVGLRAKRPPPPPPLYTKPGQRTGPAVLNVPAGDPVAPVGPTAVLLATPDAAHAVAATGALEGPPGRWGRAWGPLMQRFEQHGECVGRSCSDANSNMPVVRCAGWNGLENGIGGQIGFGWSKGASVGVSPTLLGCMGNKWTPLLLRIPQLFRRGTSVVACSQQALAKLKIATAPKTVNMDLRGNPIDRHGICAALVFRSVPRLAAVTVNLRGTIIQEKAKDREAPGVGSSGLGQSDGRVKRPGGCRQLAALKIDLGYNSIEDTGAKALTNFSTTPDVRQIFVAL